MTRKIKKAGIILVTAALTSSAAATPKLKITEDTFDFGKSVQKAVLTHDFWIKSTGDEPLKIKEVVPGCGCTESWLSDSVIAPGDSARMHIIFSSGRFRGHVGKRPYFLSNATDEKTYLKIYTYLEVDPTESRPIGINPPVVDVSQFDERPRRRAKFLIENKSDKDLRIQVADSSLKSFSVKVPKKVKAGDSVEGLITVHEDRVQFGFEESFTLQFDDIEASRYTIPVRRMLQGKVQKPAAPGQTK